MDIKKPDRATLKSYFVKNAVPTAGNFADLIEGLINQRDDGLAKPAGEPLSLQADGDDASQKKAINFYWSFNDPKPAWTLSLNPAKRGWSIGDADGNSKLFIDQKSGNVGIGTTDPAAYKLNVQGAALFTGDYLYVHSEKAGRLRVGAAWSMPGLYSGDDGAKSLALGVPSGQKVYLGTNTADAWVEGGTGNAYFKGNVGIGTDKPVNKLQVAGHLHMDGNSIFFRGDDPKDQRDVIRWNRADDRLHVGGWNGVVLGHTQEAQNSVTPVVTVDKNGIVQPPWQAATFQNGWKNYGGGYNEAGYFKDSMGIVHLKGLIKEGNTAHWTVVFTLPAGYRPAARNLFVVNANGATGRIDIAADGNVIIGPGCSGTWTSIDGLTFRAEK